MTLFRPRPANFPLLALSLVLFAAPALAGPLGQKARAYDDHYVAFHCPGLGGAVEVEFSDESLTSVKEYDGLGDSTIHTGAYLAAESFRFAVTGEPEAKENVRRAAMALHHHLAVTGKKGYIARYAAPAVPPFLRSPENCARKQRCHLVSEGPYDGYFWLGDTSRDQYDGWFFGMGLAFDLVSDPELRAMIRADVKQVIDALYAEGWNIVDVNGLSASAGAVWYSPVFQMGWDAVASRVIAEPFYQQRYSRRADFLLPLTSLAFLEVPGHHCFEYYAMMFFHRAGYDIARLDPSKARRKIFAFYFQSQVRPFTRGTDNVFFDYVAMAIAGEPDPAVIARDREVLRLLPEPPNRSLCHNPPPAPACPFCAVLSRSGRLEKSALKPFPIQDQCPADFLWQRSPYKLHCCDSSDPAHVYPGIDYLLAYWMGRYHGFLGPED